MAFRDLRTTTIREFDGGLNVVNDDLNMDKKYSTIETNVFNNINGTKAKRYGTKFLLDLKSFPLVTETFNNIEYNHETKELKVIINPDNNTLLAGHHVTIEENGVKEEYKIAKLVKHEDDVIENQYYYFIIENFNSFFIHEGKGLTFTYDNRNIKGDQIVNCTYYIDKLICVSNLGEVVAVDGKLNAIILWNNEISTTINPEVDIKGWTNVTSICFCVFNGLLTIWNGVDKPIVIDYSKTTKCNYIYDTGTESNSLVPRAKYAVSFNHYLVCGNIIDDDGTMHEDRISISMRDSGSVFFSDNRQNDLENDGVYVDLGTIISSNKQQIKGLSRYRDKLVVGFDEVTLFGTLGEYEEQVVGYEDVKDSETGEVTRNEIKAQVHIPNFEDVIDNNGCICNRSYASINTELVCLDYTGVPLFKRTGIYSTILPGRVSRLVGPEIYKNFINLKESTTEDKIFSINNPKDNQYMLFIPQISSEVEYDGNIFYVLADLSKDALIENSEIDFYADRLCKNPVNIKKDVKKYFKSTNNNQQIASICYVYTLENKLTATTVSGAWSKFTGWNFQCGCVSALNDVYLINGTKIYQLGNVDYPYYADFIGDPDYPDENGELNGKEIEFEWEFPWADFGDRSATKHSRYLAISSTGNSDFSIDFFTDYIYYNNYYKKLDPSLTLNFLAGDSHGWGNGKQSYGGGRITNNELLFAWTTKFKIGKFRIHGASKDKLNINSITLYYQMGNIRR